MSFQAQVNLQPAPAVAGDFASSNPRATMLASPGGLVAGANGVTVGTFAWAASDGTVSNAGANGRVGFVHRENQALITQFLAEESVIVPEGLPVTLYTQGEFWGLFAGGAAIGQGVYAAYDDGSLSAGSAAPTNTGTVSTASTTTLTVTTAPSSPIAVGQPVSGAGIPAGATIASFGTGTGGLGTYILSAAATATASGVTATFTTGVKTAFNVNSTAGAGELAQISTWA